MKNFSLLFILAVCYLGFSCVSTHQNLENNSKSETTAPKWITDQGRLELFPAAFYVSQLAYGQSAQESREKACASISEYIKSSVISSASSSYFYKETSDSFSENRETKNDIQVLSENNLYKLEYTNPYYDTYRNQYVCIAYINREQAFNFIKPKLENTRNLFPKSYYKALEKQFLLDKITGIKRSQEILSDFYEVWDFVRAISPENAKNYEVIDSLASESLNQLKELCASVLLKIEGVGNKELLEKSGVIAELSNQFKKIGFVVGNSQKANCIALVEVKSVITETKETFETYPEIYIKIIEKGAEKISYAKKLDKIAGFDKDTVIRRTNLALQKVISSSFMEEYF